MRLVAVSIVKNEADIIEAMVRHTLAWVDHHLVFDHDSTDGTREILQALRAEGLPVSLYTDAALGNLQQERTNHLVRLAATQFGADWILPLDADELLSGPDRPALEIALATGPADQPACLPLVNYYATPADDVTVANPARRLRYCQPGASVTVKVMIPRALADDAAAQVVKGSHAVQRHGQPVASRPLPAEFALAHFPLRSPQHQALRVVLAELQKLSRGRAHAGLDLHYRLGYQLLAEDPARFLAAAVRPVEGLRDRPVQYLGGELRYTSNLDGWHRVGRALLPFLEKLATSHGQLADAAAPRETGAAAPIHELPPDAGSRRPDSTPAFGGFVAEAGLGDREGPVPEAYLPVFHWGYAPATRLVIERPQAGAAHLRAELLTYSEQQEVRVALNGTALHRLPLPRVNQKETLEVLLPLRAGRNEVTLHYAQALTTAHDPRQLAVIFLSLRID